MEIDLGTLIVQVLNFLILFGLLSLILFKPLRETMERRAQVISENLKAAEQARLEAQKRLEELERKLADIEKEAQERLNERLKYAQKVSNSIIEEAKAEAEEIRQSALREIEEAKRRAIDEIREVTLLIVREAFKELLNKEISREYTEKAIDKVIASLLAGHKR